jgi:MYXO-CTERM domain-containing protein
VEIRSGEQILSATKESWCYPHEGPFEVHCWWALQPEELLPAAQEIQIRIQSTSSYRGGLAVDRLSRFTTGTELTEASASLAPSLTVLEVIDIPESELTACDFTHPRKALFQVGTEVADPNQTAVFQIDEQAVDGSYFRAHTVFLNHPPPVSQEAFSVIKQYVNRVEPHTGCYRIWVEDGTGAATEAGDICWPGYGDTGLDTAVDTELDTGSEVGQDSDPEPDNPGSKGVPPTRSCACSTTGPPVKFEWGWGLVLLALVRTRRE